VLLVDAKTGAAIDPILVDRATGQPIKEPQYTFAPGPAASERIQRRYASRDRAPVSAARHPLAGSGKGRTRKESAR
jgi:hypothetical protein